MKIGRPSRSTSPVLAPIVGAWRDVGFDVCPRCRIERRLYTPECRADLRVCAPCALVEANLSIYRRSMADEDLVEEPLVLSGEEY